MSPAIAALAKKLKLPIALLRIEGGYGAQPRWSDGIRRGRMQSYVSQVIEPEEVDSLSKEALMEKIRQGLFVDEGVADGRFRSGKRAEFIERALYVCPHCGLSELESQGNTFRCKKCGRQATYGEDKDGNPVMIYKNPKALAWKKSQRGCVAVNPTGDIYIDGLTFKEAHGGEISNLLQLVFKDGKMIREFSLDEVRKNMYPEGF
jgi:hypothetical protein